MKVRSVHMLPPFGITDQKSTFIQIGGQKTRFEYLAERGDNKFPETPFVARAYHFEDPNKWWFLIVFEDRVVCLGDTLSIYAEGCKDVNSQSDIIPKATHEEVKIVKEQFTEWKQALCFGDWPIQHSLELKEQLNQVYVIYSGGETSFSGNAYATAADRASNLAGEYISNLVLCNIAAPIIKGVGECLHYLRGRSRDTTNPSKATRQRYYIIALRKLEQETPAIDANLSESNIKMLEVRLAIALGWNPSPEAQEKRVGFVDGVSIEEFEKHLMT